MRLVTLIMVVLCASLMLSATDATAKNDVYRWVDKDGVVHFGDRSDGPANAEAIHMQSNPGSSGPSYSSPASTDTGQQQEQEPSYAQQRRDERAKNRKESVEKQSAIDEGCKQRRQLVAQLEPSTRVMVRDEDGEVTRMDDNYRLETLAEAKDYIAEKCN